MFWPVAEPLLRFLMRPIHSFPKGKPLSDIQSWKLIMIATLDSHIHSGCLCYLTHVGSRSSGSFVHRGLPMLALRGLFTYDPRNQVLHVFPVIRPRSP